MELEAAALPLISAEDLSYCNVLMLPVRDESPLTILFAEVDNSEVYLAFDRELDTVQPAPGIFRVTVDGVNNRVEDIQLNSASREAVLSLRYPVRFDSTAEISYTDAKEDQKENVVQDKDGNDLDSFKKALTNTSNEVSDLSIVAGEVQGDSISLTFNEILESSIPDSSKFTVQVNRKKAKLSN